MINYKTRDKLFIALARQNGEHNRYNLRSGDFNAGQGASRGPNP